MDKIIEIQNVCLSWINDKTDAQMAMHIITNILIENKKPKPFTSNDYPYFIFKNIRRKGELFKDEVCECIGFTDKHIQVSMDVDGKQEKSLYTYEYLFDEYEFVTGDPFGINI